jgi:predicted  nucleic acid-binding Zn-ribbon protein
MILPRDPPEREPVMWMWLKDKGAVIGGITGVVAALVAILQLFVVSPMNRGFDAVNQRMDDLTAHMNQRFDAVNQRMDDLTAHMNQRFDAVNQRMDDLTAHMNQRFDAQDRRLDRLTGEVSELQGLVVGISERVSRTEGQIEVIREQLQTADAP